MKTWAFIVADRVAEIISIEADGPPLAERFHPDIVAACVVVPEGSAVAEGWGWDGAAFVPPVAEVVVPVVPASITRSELLLGLAGAGLITGAEAMAAATTGAVPAAIDEVFDKLPAAEALAARIKWATMAVAERDHPLIGMLIDADLATAAEVDALFIGSVGL